MDLDHLDAGALDQLQLGGGGGIGHDHRAWFGGLIAGGALLYYIPKWIRARQGINVGFVYKELPPE